uniref:Uncharacterized protein n=1 Tax=Drosophila melanogaster TaxID=7227 RepID=A0A0B4LFY7_DROME|nr:uncharacterized protein Dmel_CG44622 [Drosophila melanogaster]AHN56417.1 uncharacterized protein Dmel_CG44622 [Drosophila melanogaster]|eukprot:NP_001286622.1 uncharacterized protein Dmel_CG44622 [Drosophila melanogaster]
MCKRKSPILWILGGTACVTMMIVLLRHVFRVSTYDIIFLTPVVIVIGFASIIKLMSNVEHIHFALLSIFVIPICGAFVFLLKINSLLKDWRSFQIYFKIGQILHLTFLLGKQLCCGNQISKVISVFMLLASVHFDLFK